MSAPASRKGLPPPTAERVRELLDYSPSTGAFTWLQARGNGQILAGAPAGCVTRQGSKTYLMMTIDRRRCYAQSLAWLILTGSWPMRLVAFLDRDTLNLRAANLVLETASSNQQRRSRAKADSCTQVQGVTVMRGRSKPFQARITAGGRTTQLGYHRTAEAAGQAYQEAKARLHSIDGAAPPEQGPQP